MPSSFCVTPMNIETNCNSFQEKELRRFNGRPQTPLRLSIRSPQVLMCHPGLLPTSIGIAAPPSSHSSFILDLSSFRLPPSSFILPNGAHPPRLRELSAPRVLSVGGRLRGDAHAARHWGSRRVKRNGNAQKRYFETKPKNRVLRPKNADPAPKTNPLKPSPDRERLSTFKRASGDNEWRKTKGLSGRRFRYSEFAIRR